MLLPPHSSSKLWSTTSPDNTHKKSIVQGRNIMARSLPILAITFAFLAMFQSHARANDSRKVYIAYMDPALNSTRDVHLEYLEKVVEGITPAQALVYSYRIVITGFSARLTDKEAKKLEKLDGIRAVVPSRMLQLFTPGSWQLSEKLKISPVPIETDQNAYETIIDEVLP